MNVLPPIKIKSVESALLFASDMASKTLENLLPVSPNCEAARCSSISFNAHGIFALQK